jgi:hypothetical protein
MVGFAPGGGGSHQTRLLYAASRSNDRNMFDYRCPRCGQRGLVGEPERRHELCGACKAQATWNSLDLDTQHAIDAAILRGPIQGLIAMRDATPPIRLLHAVDLLQYRYTSGVRSDASSQ